ncbi:PTS glucose transporter subunit IIBC [Erysipelothrix larvae]|uniref:PTS glucose transporter subunit IIBC n=1 Tax=Erysipelothrix larvae TaxID=1514105 RepID=A0A0X8H0H8_9FIRM|nr:N-acetylglucosamine-specific PTS transporter subunit IIBC [Erysipelothrix larvae]AMC93806.1 PTS glucose transporter subunit IIBC [Erysipelothrix larvae]
MKFLQKLGKALMLPVSVLPAAAVLMGIGYWIDPVGWGGDSQLAAFLIKSGSAIIDSVPIIFAVGVAYGLSKDNDGAAALSGLVAFLMVTTLLSTEVVSMITGTPVDAISDGFAKINNAFIGILSGVIGALVYNRFSQTKLPDALAFFSGKRSAPIVTSVVMIVVSFILLYAWPAIYDALVALGTWMSGLGAVGAGLFGLFNRLLIPTGLHHALNAVFWQDLIGINDIGNFWGNEGIKGVTGMYQAGFFPIMMFGLLGAAIAIYQSAREENKKQIGSLMLAAGFASFFTGVTEPLEFSFMFAAPLLYLLHALLTGLSLFVSATFHWTAGFGFSAGFIDFILSLKVPIANQPFMLMIQGIVFFALYYVVFRFVIVKFNIMTPGREVNEDDLDAILDTQSNGKDDYKKVAQIILDGLGGPSNITSTDYCATRLRLEVKDQSIVNDKRIKEAGISGIVKPGKTSVQVIIGPYVQFVSDEFIKLLK